MLTWNTSRSVMNPSQPDVCIDLGIGTCCTCLAFHPSQPSLLAGGTSTGAVIMYAKAARVSGFNLQIVTLGADGTHRDLLANCSCTPTSQLTGA